MWSADGKNEITLEAAELQQIEQLNGYAKGIEGMESAITGLKRQ